MTPTEQADAAVGDTHADQMRSIRAESERLVKLRGDIANGLLAVSKAAERDARRLLSLENHPDAVSDKESADGGGRTAGSVDAKTPENVSSWAVGRRGYVMFVIGVVCGFGLALLLPFSNAEVAPANLSADVTEPRQIPSGNDEPLTITPPQSSSEGATSAHAPQGDPLVASQGVEQATPANVLRRTPPPSSEEPVVLRVTLLAMEECWVSVQVDGDTAWDRLMAPNQIIEVNALEQAVLRIGNAAALSLRINDQAARPLGAPGQVTTLHITRDNYQTFLATVPGNEQI